MENKKLTIAFVSDAIYHYNKGGKEKHIYEITTRLAKAGHRINIYTMNWWNPRHPRRIENKVHLYGISPLYPLYSGQRRSMRQAILFALSCFKLIHEDFDVIDVDHMPHLVLFPLKIVTLLKKKKLFATWNEVWGRTYWLEYLKADDSSSFLKEKLARMLGELAYRIELLSSKMPDEINSISEHTTKKLRNELHVKQKINTIPMGIDFSLINSVKPSSEKSDVIFAGRLISHKNVNFLIVAIHLLKNTYPNIRCVIVGKGPEEMKLKELVDQLQLQKNVIFYDFLERQKDLYALMKASRVFAFPSTREGFGIAALEANASGIPVVTTNHADNATRELIKNGRNGYKVALNEKKIAEKVMQLLSKTSETTNFTKSVQNFDWDLIAKRVEEVYLK